MHKKIPLNRNMRIEKRQKRSKIRILGRIDLDININIEIENVHEKTFYRNLCFIIY